MPTLTAALLLAFAGCSRRHDAPAPRSAVNVEAARVAAAEDLTVAYAHHPGLADLGLRAVAAKEDCSVLILFSSQALEQETATALFYGPGRYGIVPHRDARVANGVRGFYRANGFRGAVFIDAYGRRYPFGNVTAMEVEKAVICGEGGE